MFKSQPSNHGFSINTFTWYKNQHGQPLDGVTVIFTIVRVVLHYELQVRSQWFDDNLVYITIKGLACYADALRWSVKLQLDKKMAICNLSRVNSWRFGQSCSFCNCVSASDDEFSSEILECHCANEPRTWNREPEECRRRRRRNKWCVLLLQSQTV